MVGKKQLSLILCDCILYGVTFRQKKISARSILVHLFGCVFGFYSKKKNLKTSIQLTFWLFSFFVHIKKCTILASCFEYFLYLDIE